MKMMKRLGAIIMVIAMTLSLGITPAFATGRTTGTLTISKEASNSTFAIYKLFDMAADGNTYTYTASSNFADFFSALGAPTAKTISTYTTADAQQSFIASLQSYISSNSVPHYAEQAATNHSGTTYSATFTDLALGYYLVVETETQGARVASKDFLVSVPTGTTNGAGVTTWDYDLTPTCKDSTATFNKVIVKNGDVTTATQNIGDIVHYRLDADVPQYDPSATGIKFFITDDMSKGLTFKNDIAVYSVDSNDVISASPIDPTWYGVTTTDSTSMPGGKSIKIDFNYSRIKGFKSIKVNYTAELNASAKIGSAGNPNESYLTYTDKPGTDSTHDTEKPRTVVYTTGIAINKNDRDTADDLAGAVFELKNFSDNTVLAVYTYDGAGKPKIMASDAGISVGTTDKGMTYFLGLDAGTYKITETVAPVGYHLLPDPLKIIISAVTDASGKHTGAFTYQIGDKGDVLTASTTGLDNDILIDVQVKDDKGFTLPGTGGIGTTIFTVSGIVIILLGCCMLLVYYKKKKVSEKR